MDGQPTKIAVVTVLFNSGNVLEGFFQSLDLQQDVNIQVYVIDNSKDYKDAQMSKRLAERFGIQAKVFHVGENVGVAEGNNLGIRMALSDKCDFILLSNNDIEILMPNVISTLLGVLQFGGYSAATPRILTHGSDREIWFERGRFSRFRGITPHMRAGKKAGQPATATSIIEYAPTCFMLLDSNVFVELGLMDSRYFVYYDDADFVWRMNLAGKKIVSVPAVEIWHKVSNSTGGGASEFSLYFNSRNRILFMRKHFRGMRLWAGISWFVTTRISKMILLTRSQRKAVVTGALDGMKLGKEKSPGISNHGESGGVFV